VSVRATNPESRSALTETSSGSRQPRAKGTAFAALVRRVRGRGPEFLERLSPRTRELLDGSVLASSWYPETSLRELLEAIGGHAEWLEIGREQGQQDLIGVYRSLFRAGDMAGTLSAFSLVWSLYHDSGAAMYERVENGHVRLTVRSFALPSAALCAFTSGWLAAAGEQASGQQAAVEHASCRERGADRCVFDVRVADPGAA
jgi:hypothetical protein